MYLSGMVVHLAPNTLKQEPDRWRAERWRPSFDPHLRRVDERERTTSCARQRKLIRHTCRLQ